MLLFPSYDYQSSSTTMASSGFQLSGTRPKGLWKGRGTQHPRLANPLTTTTAVNNTLNSNKNQQDISSGDVSDSSSTSSISKRRRTSISPPPSEEIRVDPVLYWDYSHMCAHPDRLNKWKLGAKILDTSTIVGPSQASSNKTSFTLEDWKDLRDLATEGKKIYDDHKLSDAIHILRAVVHESHLFLKIHPDPSVVLAAPLHSKKVEVPRPPPSLPVTSEWYNDPVYRGAPRRGRGQQTPLLPLVPPTPEKEVCPCIELPTAFHTVLGTALFMFGCIVDSDPSLVLEGEPKTPTPYWLAAIDVFESGENLPIRTSGRVPKSMPEDWRMSANWGRTLVRLAVELLKRRKENPELRKPPPIPDYSNFKVPPPSLPTPFKTFTTDEPDWPRTSIFATIAVLRPPSTRRLSLDTFSPDELMTYAEDHLSRAIFHMPHPRNVVPARYPHHPLAPSTHVPPARPASPDPATERIGPDRPHEIYTMASEVLLAAENSETPSGRLRWARWADGIVSHVTIGLNMKAHKFLDLRAKCNLTMGTAKVEELMADWDYPNVLHTEDAEDGREYLKNAARFFEQAIACIEDEIRSTDEMEEAEEDGMEFGSDDEDGEEGSERAPGLLHNDYDLHQMKILHSEALIELGNLTIDTTAREELYAEAKRVGGKEIVLDDERAGAGDSSYGEDPMDETD